MTTPMTSNHLRYILDFQPQIARALGEIDICEPKWIEACVKTTQPLPHFAPEHQERAGRLLYFSGLGKIEIHTTVAAVDSVRGPQTIDAKHLEGQRGRSGEAAERESGLRNSMLIHQFSGRQSDALAGAGLRQRVDWRGPLDIRVEEQDQFCFQRRDALVLGCGKAR